MVLESLIGEKNIRRHPVFLFFLTLLICFGSIIIADYMFPAHSSILSIAFITIGLVPLIFNVLSDEEKEEVCSRKHFTTFFARHFNLIMMYIWIFVGVIVAFSIYYAVVPAESRTVLFEEQIKSFCMISGSDSCIGGKPLSISGLLSNNGVSACLSNEKNVASCSLFLLWNNGGVLALTIILSLLYGVGAIFTIVWNASILGIFFSETFLVGAAGKGSGMALNMLFGHGPPDSFRYGSKGGIIQTWL
ncbi:MAG: hypothetical protein NTY48_03430 [Candidatus Diapherotrites archaeon]|nr:hypothetical protein [Candidatus Diapherotrites archaeon]